MRTVAQLRRELGVGAPRDSDSLYKPIERGPRKFNPLKIPKSLQVETLYLLSVLILLHWVLGFSSFDIYLAEGSKHTHQATIFNAPELRMLTGVNQTTQR